MSASEKLKALVPYIRSPILQDNALASQRYWRALPQILAVVEAAEEHAEPINKWGQTKLGRALTALDEALS